MKRAGIGNVWEKLAIDYLKQNSIKIKCQNFKSYRGGEIDIVGFDKEGTLIFFEVKYRTNIKKGLPEESVTLSKQKSICRASDFYRARYQVKMDTPVRFDVIAILGSEIKWIKNAFEYC